MNLQHSLLFALSESHELGICIGEYLNTTLAEHIEQNFEDGEYKIRSAVNVRNREVYVIQSLYGDRRYRVQEKLIRLLFFIGSLKDAAAERVTAVIPYLCYSRKDVKTKPHLPVSTKYMAMLFEAVGTDRVITVDVHNLAAFQNAFRCRTEHLEARPLFVRHFVELINKNEVTVVSPDSGGFKRAEQFRRDLSRLLRREAGAGFMEKYRSGRVLSGETLVGDVAGKVAIIIDDLIDTGGTMARTAIACRQAGALTVHAAATHGLFTGDADRILAGPSIDRLVVLDTARPFRLTSDAVRAKLTVLDGAALFGEAIRRIHAGDSVIEQGTY